MHGSSLCACMHVLNVIPREVIVRVVNVLVVLVAIINELRSYLGHTDTETDRGGYRVALKRLASFKTEFVIIH